jgi:DNA-binding Xre family transcriptional regulator
MPKEKDILVQVADIISKKAKAKYKSNVEFADVCGIHESSIRRILQGKQNISINVLKRICDALDTKLSDLLKDSGN